MLNSTDGTALAITVGSNAQNLSREHPGLAPGDVSTDLVPLWLAPKHDAVEEAGGEDEELLWQTEQDESPEPDLVLKMRGTFPIEVLKAPENFNWEIRYED